MRDFSPRHARRDRWRCWPRARCRRSPRRPRAEAAAADPARPHRRRRQRRGDHRARARRALALRDEAARAAGHAAAAAGGRRAPAPRAHDRRPRAAPVREGDAACASTTPSSSARSSASRSRTRSRVQQLRATLERDGVPYAKFREDIRNEIVMSRLREREVENKIVITESEIDALLAASRERGDAQRRSQSLAHPRRRAREREPGAGAGAARARRSRRSRSSRRAPISGRWPPRFPKRPTRSRAASWAGARASVCRRSSTTR